MTPPRQIKIDCNHTQAVACHERAGVLTLRVEWGVESNLLRNLLNLHTILSYKFICCPQSCPRTIAASYKFTTTHLTKASNQEQKKNLPAWLDQANQRPTN
jgi:hypothetical protein